jgi:NADH:ubiquinone oxidoreductase subunit E
MTQETQLCIVCGENSTHNLGGSEALPLCNNTVCYHASIQLINEALETKVQGVP